MFGADVPLKSFAAILGSALIATGASAANPEPVTVEVQFVAPITITENNALQYGLLDVNLALAETVIIAPDGTVTDGGNNVLGGSQAAADLTVVATAGLAINILVDNIVANTGYTLATFICDYNGGADLACDGAGLDIASAVVSAAVRVGATLTGDGAAAVGTQNGSFDVTVIYQ
ncbi:MAG: DUF4402 domain-containing protein [Gammaproteobacteria bacterium]|nr:DUF4402 domain-containing protein [Gammaproteobacteria bacterium]